MYFCSGWILVQYGENSYGTLIEVGLGKRKAYEMENILEAKDRSAAGVTAPAQGLVLVSVEYDRK